MPSRVSAQQYGDWGIGIIYGGKTVTITTVGSKEALDVNLVTGDIQIGAVELKDGESDTRAKIKSDGVDNALVVIQNSSPLPAGGATEVKQDDIITELKLKADLTETQPVSNVSLPLPAGASTSAKQLANDHDVNVSNMIPAVETGNGSDGTNSWVTVNMTFTEPIILKYENEDEMSLTVNDDLTGLLELKVGASCKVEDRYIVDECVPK